LPGRRVTNNNNNKTVKEHEDDIQTMKAQLVEVVETLKELRARPSTTPQPAAPSQNSYAEKVKLIKQLQEQEEADKTVIVSIMPTEATLEEQRGELHSAINSSDVIITDVTPISRNANDTNRSNSSTSTSNSTRPPQARQVLKVRFHSAEARRSFFRVPTLEALRRRGICSRVALSRAEQQHEDSVARPITQLIRSSSLGLKAFYTGSRIKVWLSNPDEYAAPRHFLDTSRFTPASMPKSLNDPSLQQWLSSKFGAAPSSAPTSNPSTPRTRNQNDTAQPMDQSPAHGKKQHAAASTPGSVPRPSKHARQTGSSGGEQPQGSNPFSVLAGGSA
jgi:hypothetical protein